MQQIYCKLRNAIFAERGYNLDCPPLSRDVDAYFVTLNAAGKRVKFDEVLGCGGKTNEVIDALSIELVPYPDSSKALAALMFMCQHLEAAAKGDKRAREAMAAGWAFMLTDALALDRQDEKTAMKILAAAFGLGRLHEHLNRHGDLRFFEPPGWGEMLAEALPVAAERIAA